MKVIYPVLFYEEEEENYSIFVPDFENASTCGNDLEEAMTMSTELIASLVLDKMEENEKVLKASKIEQVSLDDLEKELIKKTANIHKWINTQAENLNINFSKNLEEALLEKIYKK